MMLIGAHTMAHVTLVGHRDDQSAVGAILGPYHLINALYWCHCSGHDQRVRKCPPQKQTS